MMPGEDQPRRGEADVEGAAERQVQRAVVSIDHVDEGVVGRMDEQRNAELLDAGIERLEPRMIDVIVPADAARNVDADQAELLDHAVEFIDGGLGILQRHRRRSPRRGRDGAAAPPPSRRCTSARSGRRRRAEFRRRMSRTVRANR